MSVHYPVPGSDHEREREKILLDLKNTLLSFKNFDILDPVDRAVAEMFLEKQVMDDFNLGCFGDKKR